MSETDSIISEHILNGIKECSEDDQVVEDFLKKLLFMEYDLKPGWWKDKYNELAESFSVKWSEK